MLPLPEFFARVVRELGHQPSGMLCDDANLAHKHLFRGDFDFSQYDGGYRGLAKACDQALDLGLFPSKPDNRAEPDKRVRSPHAPKDTPNKRKKKNEGFVEERETLFSS